MALNLNYSPDMLSAWAAKDNSSTLWVVGVSQPVVNYYTNYFNSAKENADNNDEALSLIIRGLAIVKDIDVWAEIPAETADEIADIVSQLGRLNASAPANVLVVKLPGGNLHLAEENAGSTVRLVADEGYALHSASLGDEDVTHMVSEQGHFIVPTVEKPTTLNVVFKQTPGQVTDISSVNADDELSVTVHGKRVCISGKDANAVVRAYDLNGLMIELTTDSEFTLDYSGVVILRIGNSSFKFAI